MSTPQLEEPRIVRLLEALRAGNFRETACDLARIHRTTLYRWMRRGEAGEEGYVELRWRVLEAEAECVHEQVVGIREAGKTDWRASAWWLERRYPKQFGMQIRVHLEEAYDEMFNALEAALPPEMFERALEALVTAKEGLSRRRAEEKGAS